MKKRKRKVPRLSRNATDEEIVRWTKSHDVFDRREAAVSEIIEDHLDQVLRDAVFQDDTAQLNMRLPLAMEGCAKHTCPPARDRRYHARPHLARGTAGTRTKSKLKLRRLKDVS
jgi:hypothetical protein